MKYPREYLAFAERVVREYPERKRECKLVAEAIEAMCHGYVQGVKGTIPSASEPERVMEALEGSKNYQRLLKFCAAVEGAIAKLSKEERAVVKMAFWDHATNQEIAEELHMDERTIQRYKNHARRKLIRHFLHPIIAGILEVNLSFPRQG
jgi:RNA polymerase sigma factor (sigma-70 family)